MPRPPGVIRRIFRERPWLTDSLVAGVYLLFATGFVVSTALIPELPPVWLVVVLGVAGTTVVLFRRRRPVLMFVLSNVLFLIGSATGTAMESALPLFTIYAVGVYRSTRAAWICFGAGTGVAVIAGLMGAAFAPFPGAPPTGPELSFLASWANLAVPTIVVLLVATLIGTNVGGRTRYVAALVDRAAQLARERDAQTEIAGARERERIARDMHDVIAHSLSVMIALAEGAHAAAPEHPDRSRDAIGRVAETGRRTLGEVRRLLGTVRAEPQAGVRADRAPQPGVDELPELVAEFTRAGLPVRLTTRGTPTTDPALELTVYRILQESLTNALRHARGAHTVNASIHWGLDAVEILVEDDAPEPTAAGEAGRGILGMRERAALYGGDVEAGLSPAGGWRVRVRLPVAGGSA